LRLRLRKRDLGLVILLDGFSVIFRAIHESDGWKTRMPEHHFTLASSLKKG
jgi:hypothetical protein